MPHRYASEYAQFKRLARTNAYRFLDNELLPPGADMSQTLSHVLAILAAFGIALSCMLLWKYVLGLAAGAKVALEVITWPDKQFQIAAAMLVAGFACVVTWEGLFPDRRDVMALGTLPVRMRTFFAAKAASIALLLGALVVATNACTFVTFPIFMTTFEKGAPHVLVYALIHVLVIFASAAFTLLALLALEGFLIVLLRYRTFQRLSSYAQIVLLLGLVALFLLIPYATPATLATPEGAALARWLPPHWFLGLYQEMLGASDPMVRELAGIARLALALAAVLAVVAYALGYNKIVRRALEEPDFAPGRALGTGRAGRWLARRLFRTPQQEALFHFIARTLARNRRSRVLLAGYLTLGLGYFLADLASLFKAGGRSLQSPTPTLVGFSLVLMFFLLLGMRVLFTLPVQLEANWVFRLADFLDPRRSRAAVRRSLFVLGVAPVVAVTMPFYFYLWGWRPALQHLAVLLLLAAIVIERMTREFTKIPFTCSFLPGKANLKLKFGPYVVWFVVLTSMITSIEARLLSRPKGFTILYGLGCAWLVFQIFKRRRYEKGDLAVTYEEQPETILQLGLST